MDTATAFLVTLAAFHCGHRIGDLWIQTHHQAVTKGGPGWAGRRACLAHVATYTATLLVVLLGLAALLDVPLSPGSVIAGQVISAGTHYFADRREPLRRVATWVGKLPFWDLGQPRPGADDNVVYGTGRLALDQSWHFFWLLVAALVTVA